MDWLLTVPLLLIELILVMQLPAEESSRKMSAAGELGRSSSPARDDRVLSYPAALMSALFPCWPLP